MVNNVNTMTNRFGLPYLGFGLGLRPKHYPDILDKWPQEVAWFEVISENFMETDGKPKHVLERVIQHYPVVMHGVGLSIGSTDPLDRDYLQKLKALAGWVNPPWLSDHLCWTGVQHKYSHDLLPVPYTKTSLAYVVDRIKQVQDYLGRPLLLENPSTYLEFQESGIPEWEFIAMMAEQADCGLLLDVNNVYVSCYNHRLDPKTYLDSLPYDRVVQIHLAGHENQGTHIIDTHDGHVIDAVWELYSYVTAKCGPVSTMIEWDAKIPEFPVLVEELEKAKTWAGKTVDLPSQQLHNYRGQTIAERTAYPAMLTRMQEAILTGDVDRVAPDTWICPKENYPPEEQLGVYVNGYRYRLFDIIADDFPVTRNALGKEAFNPLVDDYIEATPSTHFNVIKYEFAFPEFIKSKVPPFVYEVALVEKTLVEVFDLKETVPLSLEAFGAVPPEQFFEQKLSIRAASRFLVLAYPVNGYITAFHEKQHPELPALEKTYLLVYRHEDSVWRMNLEEKEYALLQALAGGMTVGEAIEKMMAISQGEEAEIVAKLQQWFAKWVQNGVLAVPDTKVKTIQAPLEMV